MTTIIRTTVALLSIAALTGCAAFLGEPTDSANTPALSSSYQKASSAVQFRELESWLMRSNQVVTAGQGANDYNRSFAQGSVIVYGEGSPTQEARNQGQKRLTAQRAAEVVAQRNLADFFAGQVRAGEVRMSSYTVKLDAFIQGAVVVASDYDIPSERAGVLLKLDLRGARGFAR